MTVIRQSNGYTYYGLANDTKPTNVPPGSTFRVYDTDEVYITYDGTNWVLRDLLVRLIAGVAAIGKLAANSGVDIGDVDILSIAAGDNNIGNVDIASAIPAGTNNIGDVDVLSVIPGTGATNLGKAIDSVAGATDTGVAPLAVRDDALAALTPIEGDYVPLRVDGNGALWTHDDALDAALSGSELQVDVVGALPAGTNNIGDVDEAAVACAAADIHAPAANTAAVVTYAAVVSVKHVITGIAWSYAGGIPSGGNLKIEDVSGTTVFTIDIDASGPGAFEFPKPKKAAAVNTAMIITLAAGGAGVTGKVSVLNHWTEA